MFLAKLSPAHCTKAFLLAATSLILLPMAQPTFAQDASSASSGDDVVLDTIVVEAARSKGELSATPGSVQIIEGEQITDALQSSGSLTRFLGRYVPGIAPDNGTLAGSGQTLRGRSIQVLVNGTPRNIALRNNSRMLSLIDPNSIERIEVINGASGIFGDGGTGGIVNIVTKTAGEDGLHGSLTTEFSTTEHALVDGAHTTTSAEVSYGSGPFSTQLNGRFRTTGDMFDGDGRRLPEDPMIGQGGGSGIKQVNLSGQTNYDSDQFDASLYGSWVYLDQDLDYFSNYATRPVSLNKNARYTGKPTHEDTKNVSGTLNFYDLFVGDVKLEAYYNDSEKRASFVAADRVANPFVYSAPGVVQDPDAQSVLFAKQAGIRSTIKTDLSMLVDGALLSWGVDYAYNDVRQKLMDGRDIIAPMEQNSYAAFAQLDVPLTSRFDIRAGVRHERFDLKISNFLRPAANYIHPRLGVAVPFAAATVTGADTNYEATVFNLGAVAHVTKELDVFANFSQGYSVPDIGAFTRRAVNIRNPGQTSFDYSDIAPDAAVVNNYEIGARFDSERITAAFSAFMSTSEKGTNITSDALTMSQNKERIWGMELTLDNQITQQWNIGTLLSYTEGEWDQDGDGVMDDDLPNSRINAPFRATLYSGYDFLNGFKVYGEMLYTSERNANDGGTRQMKIKPTITLNSRVSYDSDFGKFQLGVDNILDRTQLNPTASALRNAPIAGEGRRIFASFRKEF